MKETKKNRDAERMSAACSKHRDYFVRLYTLNHPVGFLSRADGSRSRHQGLWSPPSKHNDSIRDPPCSHPLFPTTRKEISSFPSPLPGPLSCYLDRLPPLRRAPLLYHPSAFAAKPGDPGPAVSLVTVSFRLVLLSHLVVFKPLHFLRSASACAVLMRFPLPDG